MGQSVSTPKAHPDLVDFLNFPKEALESLWTSYNLLGEGWGLNVDEMIAIFRGAEFVASRYQFTEAQLRGLFKAFDTDNNGLVDALELFVTLALTSGMDTIDKIYFAFCAYDFDNAGSLSFDEATLLLRSVAQGLGKVSPSNVIFTSPTAKEIEHFTELVFQHSNKTPGSRSSSRVTTAEFRSYCSAHPVTSSWLKTVAQFPTEVPATKGLAAPLGDPVVLLGPAVSQVQARARHPQKTATVISEQDYLVIEAVRAAEAAEAAKPKNTDIIKRDEDAEEEDEESQEARRAAEAAAAAAAAANDPDAPVLPPWAKTVDLLRPEDAAMEARSDPPEDQIEPVFMTGVNTARTAGEAGAVAVPLMHRCVKYANMALPPPQEALPEGEEAAPVVLPTVVLGSAAAQLFVMKKEEEAGWNQRLFTQHASAITCLEVHYGKNLLVTAENNPVPGGSRVVLWSLDTFAVQTTIAVRHGVKFVDISETGAHLLVVSADLASTVTIYEIPSGKVLFARPLLLGPRTVKDCITDVRFTGTSAMFAVASALQGVTFYVEEGGSFMGSDGLRLYEERSGLYQAVGRPAVGAAVTELCRFEGVDELVAGTEKGQVLVWHGRTVLQLLDAHRTAVRALDFNRNNLTLVSGSDDGTINIYTLAPHVAAKGQKGPQLKAPRLLELSATFDILRHDLCSFAIRSLCLSADSRRALVTTAACEVMELALFITPPTPEEIAEAEAIAEAENAARAEAQAAAAAAREAAIAAGEAPADGAPVEEVPFVSAVPSLQRFLGDDVHKGPILTAHFSPATGSAASITGVCRVPGGGFATCATDSTVRLWQGAGGTEETGATVYKTNKVLKMDSGCSAVDASAAAVAVALTAEPNKDRVGSIHLFSLPDLQFITQFSEPTQEVTTMKFSPEGNLLVAASRDGVLYVYQAVEGQWSHKGVLGANTVEVGSFATKLDFSADGLYVRCFFPNSGIFRVFDVASPSFGRDIADPTSVPPPPKKAAPAEGEEAPPAEEAGPSGPPLEVLRALTWASNSCAHNWDTKGALSHLLPGATDRFNHLLLTATESGAVAVERVPQPKYAAKKAQLDASKLVTFTAHLGGVSALAFIEEGARLVTAGAQDGTLRVWKVNYDMDEFEPDPVFTEAPAATEAEEEEGEEDAAGKAAKLEAIYDSGEDDDLLDQHRMRDHLSRDNVRKRITLKAQKEAAERAAAIAAEEAAYAAAAAAAAAAEAGLETSSQVESSSASVAPATNTKPAVEPDLEVDQHSGTKWGDYLGIAKEHLALEATRALNAPPSLVPTDELELSWVYGCSARHTRAAVHYSREGTIVYPAGCLGVIYDKLNNTQRYAMPHSDEITALDVHVLAGLAVSAHKGCDSIHACLWNTADGSIRRYLDCGRVNGVSAVRFSPDAANVALTCQDPDHTVMVFSTADGRRCATYRNGSKKPLCLAFSLAETAAAGTAPVRILQGGALHFKVLTFYPARSAIGGKTGAYGADVKKSNVNCVCALPLQPGAEGGEPTGNEFLMGMADGTIGVVARGEAKASAFTAAMKGPITAMYVVKLKDGTAEEAPAFKVVVGGTNGLLKVLDQELQPVSEWNLYLNPYGLLPLGRVRGFKSLCVDKLNRKILYATAGGEVGEVELQTGVDVNKGPLTHGHFRDQLHSLCAHPLRQECITAGDDKTLRVWHLDTKKMATFIDLPDIPRCATYSPNGHLVVAGLGGEVPGAGRTPRPMRGKVVVISYLQGVLRLVHTAGDAQDTVTAVVFTPDGSKLLAASLDGNVYIYDALNNFQLLMSLTGQHKEGIRSMDISDSGQYVTTCGEYSEFFVWDLSTAGVVKASDRFEVLAATGLDWAVRQAPFGLNSVGVFPAFSDPADVLTVNQSKDHKLLAVGDSFGALKLFRNPSTEFFAPHKRYACHSPGGVSKVAFTVKDQFLLSTGRSDRLLAQWNVVKSSDLPDPKMSKREPVVATVPEEDYAATYTVRGVNFAEESLVNNPADFASIRAQLSAIVGSGNSAEGCPALPKAAFFGHGDLLTCNGRLPVLLDVGGTGAQKLLFAPPAEDSQGPYANPAQQQVSAFAVSPSGKFAAIGHAAGASGASRFVMVGAPSGQLVSELAADIAGGVVTVSFSEDGLACACLGGDAQHTLHLFRTFTGTWEDAAHIHSAQVSAGDISLLGFIPAYASAAALSAYVAANAPPPVPEATVAEEGAEVVPVPAPSPASLAASGPAPIVYDLVTAGAGHIKFWRLSGLNLYSTCGDYGAELMNKPTFTALTACLGGAYFRGQVVTGDAEGHLHFWRGGMKISKVPAHHSTVTALRAFGSFSEAAPPSLAARRIATSTSNVVRATSGFVSGSNDKLIIWSTETDVPQATHTFSVQQLLSSCGWSSAMYLSEKLNKANYITSVDTDPVCGFLAVSFASSPIITLAKDSKTVQKVSEGHARTSTVTGIVAHPSDCNTVLTLASDGLLRLWDVSGSSVVGAGGESTAASMALVGTLQLHHTPTAAAFLNATTLFVAVSGADTNGSSGSILVVTVHPNEFFTGIDSKYNMKIVSRLHNIGTGALLQLRVSPNFKYLAASCSDGCAYMFRLQGVDDRGNLTHPALSPEGAASGESKGDDLAESAFVPLGFLLAHPTGAPVAGVDFTADERYARTFSENFAKYNGKVEVNFFDLSKAAEGAAADDGGRVHAGAKLQDPATIAEMKTAFWASVSSSAASEVRGVNYTTRVVQEGENAGATATVLTAAQVSSVSCSSSASSPLVCAGYEDGSVSVYRFPAYAVAAERASQVVVDLNVHSAGAVLSTFTAPNRTKVGQPQRLVTVGQGDGSLMVWDLEA